MSSMIKTKINGKWDLILPEHRKSQWSKPWEEKRLDHMSQNIGKDDMVYYIGAEEGDIPALCSKWGANIFMFEPGIRVWANIKAIWEANELPKPMSYVGFASDRTTNEICWSGFPPEANGEIVKDHGFLELKDRNALEVKFDDIYEHYQTPTVLAIDVEGSEWLVLKGAEKLLREHHPKIYLSIHPEFMFRMFGHYQAELRKWIKDLGYKETLLDYQHEVHLFYEKI